MMCVHDEIDIDESIDSDLTMDDACELILSPSLGRRFTTRGGCGRVLLILQGLNSPKGKLLPVFGSSSAGERNNLIVWVAVEQFR